MSAEERASLAWLAATASALETHYREIADERNWARERLRSAMESLGLTKFECPRTGVRAAIVPSRRRYLRKLGGGRYRLVRTRYLKIGSAA